MKNNLKFALFYRLTFALISIVGVIFNTKMLTPEFNATTFLFYTTQSNLLAFLLFVTLFILSLKGYLQDHQSTKTSYLPTLSFTVMINIFLTFIVFWTLLAPEMLGTNYNLFSFSNLAVHTITPLAVMVDYFLFNSKKELKYRATFYPLLYPLLYSVFVLLNGLFKGVEYYSFGISNMPKYFPYFFFDFYTYGPLVIVYLLMIALFLLLLSHLAYFGFKAGQKRILLNKHNREE